ncbi:MULTISPECIES: RagB/SusD family nutrient uptake outer membrane protein [Sphingobacterium]|uniref:RagB/SusD family nutrient uptake outer membrane protein n=1 Tax=Sphingobacterium TaxID=28453 RepID=UPI001F08D8EF|nr:MULTISPECIES: RagB/SusD family nutrient uptake outer membrane protein [unclassified Sphingobacterium]
MVYRYSDVLLKKAEAILRGGNGPVGDALVLINAISTERGASLFTSLTLDGLLDERAR